MDKNCGQTNIPQVNNESPCTDFIYSQCVILNKKSDIFKNIKGLDLNEYTTLLEGEIRLLRLENKRITKIIANLLTIIPEVGIGVYED